MPMTQEQKEAGKAARRDRSREYRERRNLHDAALAAALAKVGGQYDAAYEAVAAAREDIRNRRTVELDEIDRQINTLMARKAEISAAYEPLLAISARDNDEAWKARDAERRAAQAAVDAEYPDMVGAAAWSAASWDAARKRMASGLRDPKP